MTEKALKDLFQKPEYIEYLKKKENGSLPNINLNKEDEIDSEQET